MHKIGEWTYKLKDNKKFIKWNELQEFGFSKAFIDNMPIVLQIENERDRGKIRHENFLFKEIPIRGLGSNNHTTFGSTFYLIQRNLVTMKKKTENLEIQIKKLKKLTYLP